MESLLAPPVHLLRNTTDGQVTFNLTTVLVILYFLAGCAVFYQICQILYHRHKKKSFQFAFEILCFFWVLLRLVFFVHTWLGPEVSGAWPCFLAQTIYWLASFRDNGLFRFPMNIEFATFALLVVFYIKNERRGWTPQTKRKVQIAYGSANVFYFLLFTGWIVANVTSPDCVAPAAAVTARFVFSGCVFLSLAILLPLFCYRLVKGSRSGQVVSKQNKQTVALTSIITAIFITRVIYNFISIDPQFQQNVESGSQIPVEAFAFFILWEIIPTMMVVFFFRKIPRTRPACWRSRKEERAASPALSVIPPHLVASALVASSSDAFSSTPLIQGTPPLLPGSYTRPPGGKDPRRKFDKFDRYDTDEDQSMTLTPGFQTGYFMPPGSRASTNSYIAYSSFGKSR